MASPPETDVTGADLTVGDTVVEHLLGGGHADHLIDHFAAYPGRFCGDNARRAYDTDGQWCATIGDHEPFHRRAA